MVTIKELIRTLEEIAPPRYQESYDNAGLITGSPDWEITGVITCLDSTEAVVEEAIERGCNLIVAHHPIIFRGLKKLTGRTYVERTVIKAIRHDIAIYAIHTNLDNVYHQGVNTRFAERLGLERLQILAPKAVSRRMSGIIPMQGNENLEVELGTLGAKGIQVNGIEHDESTLLRISFSIPEHQTSAARKLLHNARGRGLSSWEDKETTPAIGSGMIGFLPQAMEEPAFLQFLKERMQAACVKHTALLGKPVQRVAICGGAGGFLLSAARRQQADVFVTADYKYHEYFDADGEILIADIGHYESEQFTIDLLAEIISNKFSTFAVYKTGVQTNPVSYFV